MFRVPHLSAHPGHPFLVTAAARKVQASQAIPRQENPRKRPREPPVADKMAASSISLRRKLTLKIRSVTGHNP